MKTLLIAMAVVEVGAGLALLIAPSFVSVLLLGSPLEGTPGLIVARICGAGLLSLGVACLLARDAAGDRSATGIVMAMLVYNALATAVFGYGALGLGLKAVLLWPVIVIHAALGIWCLACLRSDGRRPRVA
jgi:hypothetical protein